MHTKVRSGKALRGLATFSVIALGGIAAAQSPQTQDPARDPSRKEPLPSVSTTVNPTQSVSKAIADLRKAVTSELEKSPSLQGKTLESNKLLVTILDENNVIAGAPLSGSTLGSMTTGSTAGGAIPGTDPNRPPDPNRPAAGREDGQILGALMVVGSFACVPDHGMPKTGDIKTGDTTGRPTDGAARPSAMDTAATKDLVSGTYMVRRGSASLNAVEIVDATQKVVATVPLLNFEHTPRELGAVIDTPRSPGDTAHPRDVSQREASAPIGGPGVTPSATADWDKIYMSIVHHFSPKFG